MDPLQLSIDPQQLGIRSGSGTVISGIIGFAAKKIAKLIAVIVGLELVVFKSLESRGIITVDWERLTGGFMSVARDAATGMPPDWISTVLSALSISAGFSGGLLAGFERGQSTSETRRRASEFIFALDDVRLDRTAHDVVHPAVEVVLYPRGEHDDADP